MAQGEEGDAIAGIQTWALENCLYWSGLATTNAPHLRCGCCSNCLQLHKANSPKNADVLGNAGWSLVLLRIPHLAPAQLMGQLSAQAGSKAACKYLSEKSSITVLMNGRCSI